MTPIETVAHLADIAEDEHKKLLNTFDMKEEMAVPDIADVVNRYAAFRGALAATKELKKILEGFVQGLVDNVVVPRFEEKSQTSITIGGRRFTVSERSYASITAENKEVAYDWLRKSGNEHLIIETVNASSLSSAVKEWRENNTEIPDCITVFPKKTVSVTKVQPKA